MGYSEIAVILLVYSGLMIFFLVPFQSRVYPGDFQLNQVSFLSIFKSSLIEMFFQKKATLALGLFVFALISIWLGFASEEWHYNAHSGYPEISNQIKEIYSICGLLLYTTALFFVTGFVRAKQRLKNVH